MPGDREAFTDTSVDLAAGASVTITATGIVCHDPDPSFCFGPDGVPLCF